MTVQKFSVRTIIALLIVTVIFFLLTIGLLTVVAYFNQLVQLKLTQSISITPGSAVYSNWVMPETPVLFTIHLFNITNKEEILNGSKPQLQEIGPYVYREKREKVNITWPKDGKELNVTFYQRITYFLDRNLSKANPDTDVVIGLSVPFVTMSANMLAYNVPNEFNFELMDYMITSSLFVRESATNYIWGYADPIVEFCNLATPDECKSDKIGLMSDKNGTDSGPFTINTGVGNISQLGEVITYNGKRHVDVWSSKEANEIRGTDGSQLPPLLNLNSTRYIFSADLCRSFRMRVEGVTHPTNSNKLKVFSIGGTPDTAEHASVNPNNLGFCPANSPGPKCPPAGLFDLSSCKATKTTRPPIYTSQPNFLGADPNLRLAIDGLRIPTVEDSGTKVLVEPTTGLVLEAYKRMQINLFVTISPFAAKNFKDFPNNTFMPVIWFEESAVADSESLERLYDNLYVKPSQGYVGLLVLFASFLTIFLLTFFLLICQTCSRRRLSKMRNKKTSNTSMKDTNHMIGYSKVSQQMHTQSVRQNI